MELEVLSKLHVGTGQPSEFRHIDNPVRRMVYSRGSARFIIPASTLKGALRAYFTALANSDRRRSCTSPRPEEMVEEHAGLEGKCLSCDVFGGPEVEGKAVFYDALADDVTPQTGVGIAIDRETGTVKEGFLYTYEFLPPKTVFRSKILLRDLDVEEWVLLLASLRELEFRGLGGKKGLVRVNVRSVEGEVPGDEKVRRLLSLMR
ncbi:MAG: RAMP superfamily CRISPR-associated protein [Candidatus Jordarchaeales archaeon]